MAPGDRYVRGGSQTAIRKFLEMGVKNWRPAMGVNMFREGKAVLKGGGL